MINKIIRFIKIIQFLLFNKNNWLRNYIIDKEKFKNLSSGILSNDLENLIDNLFNLSNSRLQQAATGKPFNNQNTRTDIITNFLKEYKPDEIFETGTLLGNTTEFFGKFDAKVTSVEISELYFLISKIRFIDKKNIKIIKGNSSDVLLNIIPNNKRIFFYLDAHSQSSLPLKKEIHHCLKFENSVILIDDFKVPKNDSFGYDTYNNLDLSLENYNEIIDKDLYFPNYKTDKDVGNRGYVIIDTSGRFSDQLNKNNLLLRHN
tara:strand:- start:681 stop:1463 length:783 start_codon:yes stop_codon:yes gene_type:complete